MDLTKAQRRAALGVCLLATVWSSPGQTYLISAFYEPLLASLALTKTELSATYLAGTLLAAIPLAYVGRVSDRFGPRRTLIGVVLGLGAACAAMANVQGAIGLLATFAFLRLLGQGSMNLVSSHALALSYERGLGSVEGIRLTAIAFSVALFPGLAVFLGELLGWRNAWYLLGAAAVLTVVPAAWFGLRALEGRARAGAGAAAGASDDLRTALRSPAYWILAAVLATNAAVITAIHFHVQALVRPVGLDPSGAARAMATYAALSLLATLVGGWSADRVRPRYLFAGSVFCLGLGSAILGTGLSASTVHLGMGTLGLAQGIAGASIGPVVARRFGRAHYGAIRGSFATVTVAGTSVGPLVLGWWGDTFGTFDGGLYLFALVALPCVIAAATLKAPPR